MDTYLPLIISLFGTVFTVGVSLYLGIAKQRTENKTAMEKYSEGVRDDLFALNERYERELNKKEEQIRLRDERIERKNEQLAAAQAVISNQMEKITDLTLTVKQLQYQVESLREELDKFNKKVFYVKDARISNINEEDKNV